MCSTLGSGIGDRFVNVHVLGNLHMQGSAGPAVQEPELLAEDIRSFFRPLR